MNVVVLDTVLVNDIDGDSLREDESEPDSESDSELVLDDVSDGVAESVGVADVEIVMLWVALPLIERDPDGDADAVGDAVCVAVTLAEVLSDPVRDDDKEFVGEADVVGELVIVGVCETLSEGVPVIVGDTLIVLDDVVEVDAEAEPVEETVEVAV